LRHSVAFRTPGLPLGTKLVARWQQAPMRQRMAALTRHSPLEGLPGERRAAAAGPAAAPAAADAEARPGTLPCAQRERISATWQCSGCLAGPAAPEAQPIAAVGPTLFPNLQRRVRCPARHLAAASGLGAPRGSLAAPGARLGSPPTASRETASAAVARPLTAPTCCNQVSVVEIGVREAGSET
jgi:hypothetical protein